MDIGRWRITIHLPQEKNAVSVVRVNQVHGEAVTTDTEALASFADADGIVVQRPGVIAGVATADCMPLIVMTADNAAVLHVSRLSLMAGLLDNLGERMNLKNIMDIFIGPHICSEHFSFSWEGSDISAFRQKFPFAIQMYSGVLHLSLRSAVQKYFDQWKVASSCIYEDGRCTFEFPDLPSYRRWRLKNSGKNFPRFLTTVQLLS